MNSLKIFILDEVRKNYPEFSQLDNYQLNHLLFYSTATLRLTYTGFITLKKIFTAYSFDIPMTIKSKHRYAMSKLESPYFFTKNRLIIFSEMDAAAIKLNGNIEKFLENFIF